MIKIEDIVLDGKESNSSGRKMPAMTEEEKDILQHHGVIGMRWGKGRKTKVPKQTLAPKAKGVNEAAREQQFKNEYANRDKMSTRSLQNRVKRLQAEQQFKELVNKPAAERAKAEAAIAEKKRKRNKMLLRTALGIYGNLPMDSFGKKGKDLKEILGPSQAIAKAATSSGVLKNSAINDETENVILHYGVRGMHWGTRRGRAISRLASSTEGTGLRKLAVTSVKNIGNSVAHPLVTSGVVAKNAAMHPIMTATSPITMLKKNNQDIRSAVINNKHIKKVSKIHKSNVAIAKDNVKLAAAKKKYGKGTRDAVKLAKAKLKVEKENLDDYSKVVNMSSGVMTSAQYKAKKKQLATFGKNLKNKKTANRESVNNTIALYKKRAKQAKKK